MKRAWWLTMALSALMVTPMARAEDGASTQPSQPSLDLPGLAGRPDEPAVPADGALGPRFSSQAGGISLCPPAGCKLARRPGTDTIAEFASEKAKMRLTITRSVLSTPMALSIPASSPASNNGKNRGLLEVTADDYRKINVRQILRQDVIPLAKHDAGILILRADIGVQHEFIQQAIVQSSEQLYYNITLRTPGEPPGAPADRPSPTEAAAAKAFQAMLDTVELLDLSKIRADQDQRLYATRTLFLDWTEKKLRSVLIPEQWMRTVRDGKDVGYSYIVEQLELPPTNAKPAPDNSGIKIGIRSRSLPKPGMQIDSETWYHITFDRKTETWSTIALCVDGKDKFSTTEFGSSQNRRKPVPDPLNLDNAVNPGIKLVDEHTLTVQTQTRKVKAPPFMIDLPPWYLSQALGYLLPRILPINQPHGYLFYSYVSSEGQVMLRYVDVGAPKTVTFNGQTLQVVPISDRITIDGTPTVYYVDLNGKYLGSETIIDDGEGNKSTVDSIPTDAATLEGLWHVGKLTAPATQPVVPKD